MSDDAFKPIGLDRSRLSTLMKQRNLDGIFLSSPENVFYTTGYPTLPSSGNPIVYALRNQLPFFTFIGKDGGITLLCWGAASMGLDYGADDVRAFFTFPMSVDELKALVQEKLSPGCTVGVESTFPFYAIQLIQEHARPADIQIIDDLIHRLRLVKSRAEIDRIKRSTQIVDQTVLELAQNSAAGDEPAGADPGGQGPPDEEWRAGVDHVTVAFGSANPEVALGETLEENQVVTLDLGGCMKATSRTTGGWRIRGRLRESRQLHQKLCWVVAEMGKALRPGKTFAELHAYAYELYAKVGVEPLFLHVGHSIGLQVDEHWILGDDPTVVEKGMVLNIELYSGSDEGVMIGDEETFEVTDGEPEQLSRLPPEIIERKFS